MSRKIRLPNSLMLMRVLRVSKTKESDGSVNESAEILGFNKKCLYAWIKEGCVSTNRGTPERLKARGYNSKTLAKL